MTSEGVAEHDVVNDTHLYWFASFAARTVIRRRDVPGTRNQTGSTAQTFTCWSTCKQASIEQRNFLTLIRTQTSSIFYNSSP